jgi:hypothetical protein
MVVGVEAAGMVAEVAGVEAAGMAVVAVGLLRFTVAAAGVAAGMAEAVGTMVAWPTLVGVAMH